MVSNLSKVLWLLVSIVNAFFLTSNLASTLESFMKQLTIGLSLFMLLSKLADWQLSNVCFFVVFMTVLSTKDVFVLRGLDFPYI